MTQPNPYDDPHADDDILRNRGSASSSSSETHVEHVLDGSLCPCGQRHNFALPEFTTNEILDRLASFLDRIPENGELVISSGNTLANKIFKDFVDFVENVDESTTQSIMFRMLCEFVSDLVGEDTVLHRLRLYQAEQYLVNTHFVLKSVNDLAESWRSREDLGRERDDVLRGFDVLLSNCQARLQFAGDRYRKEAAEIGANPDERLLEVGLYSDSTSIFGKNFMPPPPPKKEGE